MARAKAKPAGRVIRGGVNAAEVRREAMGRPIAATIERRANDRLRLRLSAITSVKVGDKFLLDADWQTSLAVVYAVHPQHRLVDVTVRGGLFDERAYHVKLRRAA